MQFGCLPRLPFCFQVASAPDELVLNKLKDKIEVLVNGKLECLEIVYFGNFKLGYILCLAYFKVFVVVPIKFN